MTEKKKHGLIFATLLVLTLGVFLYLPFPLLSHFAKQIPIGDDPLQNALSDTYILLYNWWVPKLPETNPYKRLILEHTAQLCLEHKNYCDPTRPRVPD